MTPRIGISRPRRSDLRRLLRAPVHGHRGRPRRVSGYPSDCNRCANARHDLAVDHSGNHGMAQLGCGGCAARGWAPVRDRADAVGSEKDRADGGWGKMAAPRRETIISAAPLMVSDLSAKRGKDADVIFRTRVIPRWAGRVRRACALYRHRFSRPGGASDPLCSRNSLGDGADRHTVADTGNSGHQRTRR